MKIVTFSCSKLIHVYDDKCGLSPVSPYKTHCSIKSAEDDLKLRGVKNIKIKHYREFA